MKKIFSTIFAAILLVAATLNAFAQAEESRQVSGFNSIAAAGPFDVHVNINGTESLKISAAADMLKQIETVVEDGKLEIKFKNHHQWDNDDDMGKISVYVTAKSLSSLINSGSGSIKVDGSVTGNHVNVVLSGSGDIESSVKTGNLHATISGSGSIKLNGSTDEAKVVISGSGQMKGKDLKTNTTSVVISGSGNAYFSAEKSVSAHIAGSGNVVYSGNATVTDSRTAGSGRVTKED